jgi:hypothetical protein
LHGLIEDMPQLAHLFGFDAPHAFHHVRQELPVQLLQDLRHPRLAEPDLSGNAFLGPALRPQFPDAPLDFQSHFFWSSHLRKA